MTIAVPHAVTREIRGAMPFSAIVDIDGVHNPKTGGFHQIDDAIDAGHKSIFVRDGTYKSFTADVANLTIMGESIDAIVDGSLTTAHGCTLSAAHVKLIGLTFKTTSGGGDTISGIDCSDAAGDYFLVDRCHFPGSDHNGIDVAVAMNAPVIQSCTFTGTFDSSCVTFGNNTQHGKLLFCQFTSVTTGNAIHVGPSWGTVIQGCGFYLCSSKAINICNSATVFGPCIVGNVFRDNTGYAVDVGALAEDGIITNNIFHGDTLNGTGTSFTIANNETF